MKRVLSIIISIIIMLCTVSISTEAKEITLSSNKYETNFNHFIYGDYADDPGFVPDYETYEEVYYHYTSDNKPDWVIVNASFTPEPGMCYGIFDYVALINCPSCSPFPLGLGVYDVQADTFYSFEKAWEMDFSELHKTFLDIMTSDKPINGYYQYCLLGDVDKDGEISVIDATQIQKFAAEKTDLQDDDLFLEYSYRVYGPNVKYRSDFNCDGARDVIDASSIQSYLVGCPYPKRK